MGVNIVLHIRMHTFTCFTRMSTHTHAHLIDGEANARQHRVRLGAQHTVEIGDRNVDLEALIVE